MNDQQIKEKMEKLNTLSGGIVFGKEEAWNKLQARMEHKKTVVLPVKYWTAAAVLLLSVSIAIFHQRPVTTVAHNNKTTKPVLPQQNTTIAHTDASIQNSKEQPIAKKTTIPHHIPSTKPAPVKILPFAITPIQTNCYVSQADNMPVPVASTIAAVSAPAKPMKVVYITDAERYDENRNVANGNIAVTSPTPDFKKMPVQHINDVVNDEEHIKAIMRENRMTSGHGLFFRRNADIDNITPNTGQYNESYPLLKKIFNPQN